MPGFPSQLAGWLGVGPSHSASRLESWLTRSKPQSFKQIIMTYSPSPNLLECVFCEGTLPRLQAFLPASFFFKPQFQMGYPHQKIVRPCKLFAVIAVGLGLRVWIHVEVSARWFDRRAQSWEGTNISQVSVGISGGSHHFWEWTSLTFHEIRKAP